MNENNVEDVRVLNIDLTMNNLKNYFKDRYGGRNVPRGIGNIYELVNFYSGIKNNLNYIGRANFVLDIFKEVKKLNSSYVIGIKGYVDDLMRSLYSPDFLEELSEVKEDLSSSNLKSVRGLVALIDKIQEGELHPFDLDQDNFDKKISKAKIDLMQTQAMRGVEGLGRVREKSATYFF